MNGIRCPKCNSINPLESKTCYKCEISLADVPKTQQVSVPAEELFQAQNFSQPDQSEIPRDNELGRKTFFWYRVYLGFLAFIYLASIGLGGFLIFVSTKIETNSADSLEAFFIGIFIIILGLIFFIVSAVLIFLPRKPWNWVVGIVALAIGMTSCLTLPIAIPVFINWLKPETKVFFGRN